jgi:sugar O-acyltransferase (sialic acid O-acetyltransferase NeuD family)
VTRVIIVGGGGHGRSVAEIVLADARLQLVGFVDDAAASLGRIFDLPVLATTHELVACRAHADAAVVAIGNNRLREEFCNRAAAAGFELPTIVHPRAIVAPSASIAAGCTIMAGAIIGTQATLGRAVIVNSGSVVDHHCRVDDFGHVGANASMAGGSVLGRGAWMQAGAALGYNVSVPAGAVLTPGEARRVE